jgi:hypothetical protein
VNEVLDDIRAQVNKENIIKSCSGDGCRVYMTDVPFPRVVIDVEREFDSRKMDDKRCDRLLFYVNPAENNLVAAPIELKSGKADESEVVAKLENSLEFAANIAPGLKTLKTVYAPILFRGGDIKWAKRKKLKQLSVPFRGRNLRILIGRCGAPKNLAKALSDSDNL